MKKVPSKNKRQRFAGLTLAIYAKAKLLKISFLKKLGLSDMQLGDKPAVAIPYKDVEGVEQATRIRVSLTGARFRWAKGSEPCLYGLWRLEKMRSAGYVVLCEGESDVHTLWSEGFAALGLPGANSWREPWAPQLTGIPVIYIIIEPDRGGDAVLKRLTKSGIRQRTANMRSSPRSNRDLMITARNSHVIALDNLSHLPDWLSDALCRLATGGGFGTRELYTDDDEVVFNAMRPILLNGIGEVTTRADLMERTIMISLPALPKKKRLPEAEFWQSFGVARPRILGVLLDAVSFAIGEIESVKLNELPRMADFAKWSTAAEESFGFWPGAFQLAYESNLEDAHVVVLDSSPVASLVRKLLDPDEKPSWVGTASQLLEELGNRRGSGDWGQGFPRSANGLSCILRRLAPNLRATGIVVEFIRRPGTGERLIKMDLKS